MQGSDWCSSEGLPVPVLGCSFVNGCLAASGGIKARFHLVLCSRSVLGGSEPPGAVGHIDTGLAGGAGVGAGSCSTSTLPQPCCSLWGQPGPVQEQRGRDRPRTGLWGSHGACAKTMGPGEAPWGEPGPRTAVCRPRRSGATAPGTRPWDRCGGRPHPGAVAGAALGPGCPGVEQEAGAGGGGGGGARGAGAGPTGAGGVGPGPWSAPAPPRTRWGCCCWWWR